MRSSLEKLARMQGDDDVQTLRAVLQNAEGRMAQHPLATKVDLEGKLKELEIVFRPIMGTCVKYFPEWRGRSPWTRSASPGKA